MLMQIIYEMRRKSCPILQISYMYEIQLSFYSYWAHICVTHKYKHKQMHTHMYSNTSYTQTHK